MDPSHSTSLLAIETTSSDGRAFATSLLLLELECIVLVSIVHAFSISSTGTSSIGLHETYRETISNGEAGDPYHGTCKICHLYVYDPTMSMSSHSMAKMDSTNWHLLANVGAASTLRQMQMSCADGRSASGTTDTHLYLLSQRTTCVGG